MNAEDTGKHIAKIRTHLTKSVLTALLLLVASPALTQGYERLGHDDEPLLWPGGGSVIDTIRLRGLLKVGIGLFEPWVMCDTNGELIGYEIDVARKMAEDMGVRIRFVHTNWYFIVPALIEGEFDLIISGMGITPERSLLVNFSVPYSVFGTAIVANSMRTAIRTEPPQFNQSEVLFGARSGTIPAQTVKEHFPNAVLRLFDTDMDLLQALVTGDVHAVAVDQVKATRWLHTHPEELHRPFEELFNKVPEAIALRRGDIDGVNFLDSWITHHRTSGWLAERRAYWFDTRDWADQVASDPEAVFQCQASFR